MYFNAYPEVHKRSFTYCIFLHYLGTHAALTGVIARDVHVISSLLSRNDSKTS